MSKRFYAVQVGDDFSTDTGSTVKRQALRMARSAARKFPGLEVRLCLCTVDDDFCEGELIIQEGRRV